MCGKLDAQKMYIAIAFQVLVPRSFGIAMWEVCTFAKQPYESMREEEIIQELKATGKCRLNSPFSNADYLAPL